ncbi:MAG TPA: hypothetical protein PK650_13075 [Candidatus Sumerlaeota bacterium]|nr:hypothetical protein [Candidatus Sumerlaeota bacterium]HOE64674.1 hypothetical protein [Candidatus Sumerlaeota bacterium]
MPETTYGWVTETYADDYMQSRLNVVNWFASGANKVAALMMAYRQLISSPLFSFTSTISEQMKWAQLEQALFLLNYSADIDARSSLRSQGVQSAGIVQESYKELNRQAICEAAMDFLKDYKKSQTFAFGIVELQREETTQTTELV